MQKKCWKIYLTERWLDMKNVGRKGIEYYFKRGF